MLQYSTVEPNTLDVLKKLMAIPELNSFYLVGGTALALYYGHRLSVDLDLFSTEDFDTQYLISAIEREFKDFTYSNPNPIGLFGFIGDIKVDFVRYFQHTLIAEPMIIDGIRLISIKDIMAMKIAAILKRGVKKDFWDMSELLRHYSIQDIIDAYNQKFPNQQMLISIPRAITYFIDAEESEDPVSKKGQTWKTVKLHIEQKVAEYLK